MQRAAPLVLRPGRGCGPLDAEGSEVLTGTEQWRVLRRLEAMGQGRQRAHRPQAGLTAGSNQLKPALALHLTSDMVWREDTAGGLAWPDLRAVTQLNCSVVG